MSTLPDDDEALARVSAITDLIKGICDNTIDPDSDYAVEMSKKVAAEASKSSAISAKGAASKSNQDAAVAAASAETSPEADAGATTPAEGRAGNGMSAACQQYCQHCKWEYYSSADAACRRCAKPTVPAAPRRERLLQVCADKATRIATNRLRRTQYKQWMAERAAKVDSVVRGRGGAVAGGAAAVKGGTDYAAWDFWEPGTLNSLKNV